ncbi:unnamed protein product [marine sediment metagenome]|uniref:Uncharacterized protein n=1 Tax=marine sediment metagenome TaxID=412755 RepID=X0VSB9_9ZZZZ
MSINIKVNKRTSDQLTALSAKRKIAMCQNKTKQDIVAELINLAYIKEIK